MLGSKSTVMVNDAIAQVVHVRVNQTTLGLSTFRDKKQRVVES